MELSVPGCCGSSADPSSVLFFKLGASTSMGAGGGSVCSCLSDIIYPFHSHLLSAHHVPGTVLRADDTDTRFTDTDKVSASVNF